MKNSLEFILEEQIEKIDNTILIYEFEIENQIDFNMSMGYYISQLKNSAIKNILGNFINIMDEVTKKEFLKRMFRGGKIWLWSILIMEDILYLSNNKEFIEECLKIDKRLNYIASDEYRNGGNL